MAEKYIKLVDAKTADFTSEVVTLRNLTQDSAFSGAGSTSSVGPGKFSSAFSVGTRDLIVDFDQGGNGSLVIEASAGPGSPFQEVGQISTSGIFPIQGFPRMRLRLDGVTSGTHSAGLYGDLGYLPFIETLTDLGLTTNLKLCLDAGDADSYSSGQSWLDRSGNGYNFRRGADTTSSTDDPTFNGAVGGLSADEYWSFDGGDFFRYNDLNETWMENLHKNNAKWSYLLFTWLPAISSDNPALFGTMGGALGTDIGVGLYRVVPDSSLYLRIFNTGSEAMAVTFDTGWDSGAWNMIAGSIDEAAGAGGGFGYLNGAYNPVSASNTFDATYTSPSASNATEKMEIGARGGASLPLKDTTRIAVAAFWEGGVITKANFDSIWTEMRGRFGV